MRTDSLGISKFGHDDGGMSALRPLDKVWLADDSLDRSTGTLNPSSSGTDTRATVRRLLADYISPFSDICVRSKAS